MNATSAKTSWKDLLPKVFTWLDSIEIEAGDTFSYNTHYVVPVERKELKDASSITAEHLPQDIKEKIPELLKIIGKEHLQSPTTITIKKTPITLIPIINLNTSSSQKGRQIGLDAAKHLGKTQISQLGLSDTGNIGFLDIFDGMTQGLYQLNSFKSINNKQKLPEKIIVYSKNFTEEKLQDKIKFLQGTIISRMVADAPPNWLTSEKFAEIARSISDDFGLKCTILNRKKMEEMNMGAFLSVAKGTPIEPNLIAIEIVGHNPKKWVSLVGKGLTFDTGGISLKPPNAMMDMKYDMCGGASVLGSAYYLAHHKPPVSVVCIIGAVENMPSSTATRPGDIVKSLNGKTIEILNTDAEGRLVLADLLQYAVSTYKPEFIINTATLTGAVLIALGSVGSAVMSNKQEFADYVIRLSKEVGEPLWQLPLWPEFDKELKSPLADLKNIVSANVKAGTITAGAFLREFVSDTPWCHVDIAGTGWDCKATGFPNSGASAFGVRTLTQACLEWDKK